MVTKSHLARMGLFDARVPRYTSYPTAPHFSTDVTDHAHRDWIEQIAPGSEISLYIHVPFCRRLCWFCACRTQGTQSDAPVTAYLETLKAELALLARHLPAGVRLSRLHWGGGTPTLLKPGMMQSLADTIAMVAPLADHGEFSVEIDPNEIDAARLDVLVAAGMNRASIGVQDFDPDIQETIGRRQSFEVTRNAVDMIRSRGIDSLNADILFGLPHQSRQRMTESVQKLLALSPDRVALYGYAHVPWMARRQALIPTDALPAPQDRLALFDTARQLFLWDGYAEIGIDHFARPDDGLAIAQREGQLRRNFQGYTDDRSQVLIGVGASAISRFPQGYSQNAASTSEHTKAIRAGHFSSSRGHRFTAQDRLRARLIEAVMCDFRISAQEVASEFDIDAQGLRGMLEAANQAFDNQLQVSDAGLSIPEEMRPLARLIARHFDSYAVNAAGHSPAI